MPDRPSEHGAAAELAPFGRGADDDELGFLVLDQVDDRSAPSLARIVRGRTVTPKALEIACARASASRLVSSSSVIRASSGNSGETSITDTAVMAAPCSAASAQAVCMACSDSLDPKIGTTSRR